MSQRIQIQLPIVDTGVSTHRWLLPIYANEESIPSAHRVDPGLRHWRLKHRIVLPHSCLQVGQQAEHRLDQREHAPGFLKKGPPGVGEQHASVVALEERHTDRALQFLDVAAERWLCHAQPVGRPARVPRQVGSGLAD
jgi:hypothetical protein